MDDIAKRATELAAELAEASRRTVTGSERAESAQMARMMEDAAGKAFTLQMVDRVFRSGDPKRQSARIRSILKEHGVPKYLPPHQRAMLTVGAAVSQVLPGPVMSAMQGQLRRSSSRVVLQGEPKPLAGYLARRRASQTSGQPQPPRRGDPRRRRSPHTAWRPSSTTWPTRPSTTSRSRFPPIFSQINVIDWDHTLDVIKDRLRTLYRAADAGP